jgi:hypothetical protein
MRSRLIVPNLLSLLLTLWFLVPPVFSQTVRRLTLNLNQMVFRPGDTLRVGVRVQNPDVAVSADFYFVVLQPDGTAIFVTSLSPLDSVETRLDADPRTFQPLLADVQLPPGLDVTQTDVFMYRFAGGEAPGIYTVFAVLTLPGAFTDGRVDSGDLLALDARPFVFSAIDTLPFGFSP